ncbi:unnamed protein product [Allacma fusca]|uniref:Uncharacterized protein n=1 Tax=Allacma fusca TaxID=39272 RepID=A0A8J2L4A9_9HEXA|nr:unnamed protein product [Allacma fusca]
MSLRNKNEKFACFQNIQIQQDPTTPTTMCISKAACHYDAGHAVTCGEDWFNMEIEKATKKCRGTPPPPPPPPPPTTTPPPNDCCNNGGTINGTQQTRAHCSISKHPNIGKPENAFAYGLIHLADPFVFNEYVNAISLAPAGGACLFYPVYVSTLV